VRLFLCTPGADHKSESFIDHWRNLHLQDKFGTHEVVMNAESATHILIVGSQLARSDKWFEALELFREYREPTVLVSNERDYPDPFYHGIYTSISYETKCRRSVPYSYVHNQHILDFVTTEPKYLYSFMGRLTHRVRSDIFQIEDDRSLIVNTTSVPSFDYSEYSNETIKSNQQEMVKVISASKFVLCPRGVGPSSFRLYETLAMGAVPVILSDSWCPPRRVPWDSCCIRVKESDVSSLPDVLRRYEPFWEEMSAQVRHVYENYLSYDSLFNYLAEELDDISCNKSLQVSRNYLIAVGVAYQLADRYRKSRRLA
jgi:hypothetical protein